MIRHQTPSMQNKSFFIDAISKASTKISFYSILVKTSTQQTVAKLTK